VVADFRVVARRSGCRRTWWLRWPGIATALDWGNVASIAIAVVLAFFFGYSLTLRPLLKNGVSLRQATRVAFAADTVSIAVR
jgi:hypothetical protein